MSAVRCEVAIVGAGFAGSILARALAVSGREVMLVERHRHPRLTLGESSTPLAALALERLADRYGLDDLRDLAAWGRFRERRPELGRGLKRGFTFYGHRPGESFTSGGRHSGRLLVAASPSDEVADSHWVRADVDAFLAERAVAAGVELYDRCEVLAVEVSDGVRLRGQRGEGEPFDLSADFVVDATGPGGLLADKLPIAKRWEPAPFASRLLWAHFEGVPPFAAVAGASGEGDPYPADRAAVHHWTDLGWMYVLHFDHGVTSAGFLLDPVRVVGVERPGLDLDGESPETLWRRLLDRYPSIGEQFAAARPLTPLALTGRLQRRLARAAADRWALLPHSFAFYDPLFSTGIAWSLLGVERLAALLADGGRPAMEGLAGYDALMSREADHQSELLGGAYELLGDFPAFAAYSHLYFAAASYCEAMQRLHERRADGAPWHQEGFLGATDALLSRLAVEGRFRAGLARGGAPSGSIARDDLMAWVGEEIAPRNVAGLADPSKGNLYPVDAAALRAHPERVGLDSETLERRLERLRGWV